MNNYSDVEFDNSTISTMKEEFGNSSVAPIRSWNAAGGNMTRTTVVDDLSSLPPVVILITSTLLFNLIIIVVIAYEKRLHKPINAYIFSLACSDFLDGCIPMVGFMYERVFQSRTRGPFFLLLDAVADPAIAIAFLIHLILLAYDRYSAIIHPLSYSKPNRKLIISLQIIGAYAVALAAYIPPVIVHRDFLIAKGIIDIPMDSTSIVLQICLTYIFAYLAMIYLYIRCMWGIWSQFYKVSPMKSDGDGERKKIRTEVKASDLKEKNISIISKNAPISEFSTHISVEAATKETNVAVNTDNGQAGPLPLQSSRTTADRNQLGNSDQINKRRNNLIRGLVIVGGYVTAFTFLVMPYAMYVVTVNIYYLCTGRRLLRLPTFVFNLLYWMPYTHSTIHPILFMLVTREFRSAVKSIFQKFCKFLQR